MTDETAVPAAPRAKRPYVRKMARQEDVRQESARATAHGKVRQRKGAFHNMYEIPREVLAAIRNDYGADLQWNLDTVKGADGREIHDLPFSVTRVGMEQQAWESVLPGMFGGLLDGYFTKKDHKGEVVVGGQVLQWRPYELTEEARAEEYQMARAQIGAHDRQMVSGNIPGVDQKVLSPTAGSAQKITRLTKSRIASIPVPQ